MAIIYKVTIAPIKKEGWFNITWYNVEACTGDSFDASAADMTPEELERLWQKPQHRLEIGRKLFRFLDGDSRYLQRALDEASHHGESLQLHLCACNKTADWPFELLAQEDTFLLPLRLHLVRRVSDWGKAKETPPQNRPLKLLFMACSALDVEPELDFEREEEAIFRITENKAIDMEVEDSGSLDGLRQQLEQTQYDVVHLSGLADIDQNGNPYFVMENESGYRHNVYPDELWDDALIENPPRLLFLSGCRTGETPYTGAAVSFAHKLVEKHNAPAILGWGRSVADDQAIHAEKKLYHQLSLGKTILKAVQRARYELEKNDEFSTYPAWPLLRLFSAGLPLNAIVAEGQRRRPQPRRMKHVFLGNSRVQILAEGFVGRRRQLQQSLHILKQSSNKAGVLLLGTGGLGKSCLAGKICERFTDHTLIIVHGKLNAITLEAALKDAFILAQDEKGQQILNDKKEMTEKLANLCATGFKEKNYLLILDDFEQNIEGAGKGQPEVLLLEAADLMKALLHWLPFSGKMTQLIITSRYEFSLTEQDKDQVKERLEKIWLPSFQESEQRKKALELENILNYPDRPLSQQLLSAGHGNPRLMEWLDLLVGKMAADRVPQLLKAIKDKQEEFIREHVIRELLELGGGQLVRFLRRFSIYRRPVLLKGIEQLVEKAGLEGWEGLLKRGMGLSLIELDQARRTYQLTPLLREELLSELEDTQSCHKAAFEYYKKIYEAQELLDPILVEEWIFHALGCGEEKTASEQGGRLVKHLQERLAFQESRRVGMWVLGGKKRELSNEYDAFLLNETAFTLKSLGDYEMAINYYEEALFIDRSVFGESHHIVARDLNNLGTAWRSSGDSEKAIEYYEQTLSIVRETPGDKHSDISGTVLNNLGLTWGSKGDYLKAIEFYKQSLNYWGKIFGERHPNIAITLNNLGAAWNALGNVQKAAELYKQALSIDRSVYGKIHLEVATDLNNLGGLYYDKGDYYKAIEYYEEALAIWKKIYKKKHPNIAVTLANLGEAYFVLNQEEKSKRYFKKAYEIFKEFFGEEHPNTKSLAKWLT